MGSMRIYKALMMFIYPMGRALVWTLAWVMSGPGP